MKLSYMLNQMCHEAFSNADVNAIRKARGFTKTETDSRSQFESLYLSSIGLETAMSALTAEEVACLHLLNRKSREFDVTFFERVYGSANCGERYYDGTFTQRYKDTFNAVRQNLVRRGLLVMAELRTHSDNSKMERWRFRFPPAFAPFLPPLIPEPRYFDTPGDDRSTEIQRAKVSEALGPPPTKPLRQEGFICVASRGDLTLGQQPFSVKRLTEWQHSAWASALNVTLPNDGGQSLPPAEAVRTILDTLAPHEWASVDRLATAYDVFCYGVKAQSLAKVCQHGWQWGGLVRCTEGDKVRYRLPEVPQSTNEPVEPEGYLTPVPQGDAVQVDLQTIPFDALETLNILAYLEVDRTQLVATPSRVKLGRVAPEVRESPLGVWLSTRIPAFCQVFELTAKNWGKTILHTDLLVAHVKDLSLRVQLERRLGEDLVLLSDEFVAFPTAARRDVEKVIQKGGFVVKTMRA